MPSYFVIENASNTHYILEVINMTRLKDMTPDERKKWFDKMDDALYNFLMNLPVRARREVLISIIIKLKKKWC